MFEMLVDFSSFLKRPHIEHEGRHPCSHGTEPVGHPVPYAGVMAMPTPTVSSSLQQEERDLHGNGGDFAWCCARPGAVLQGVSRE